MTILIPGLAFVFAAICMWLAVRIVNCRERWAKRTLAATVGLPILYVLSFGPACWLTAKPNDVDVDRPALIMTAYWPIGYFRSNTYSGITLDYLDWWACLGIAPGHTAWFPCHPSGVPMFGYQL
ncbi:MAG TPA: hypothetical protein VGM05_12635 [Planctomycetaceae bacterium]|jgi:hypothetical protein